MAKWQTRKVQVLMEAIPCRFKSCYPHQIKLSEPKGMDFFIFIYYFQNIIKAKNIKLLNYFLIINI